MHRARQGRVRQAAEPVAIADGANAGGVYKDAISNFVEDTWSPNVGQDR